MTTSPTEDAGPAPETPPSHQPPPPGRAMVVGTGLIGGSVGLALRARGWHVSGVDAEPGVAARAVALGALDAEGEDPGADLVVVATPVHAAEGIIRRVADPAGRPTPW